MFFKKYVTWLKLKKEGDIVQNISANAARAIGLICYDAPDNFQAFVDIGKIMQLKTDLLNCGVEFNTLHNYIRDYRGFLQSLQFNYDLKGVPQVCSYLR